jgi:hypothetical protein
MKSLPSPASLDTWIGHFSNQTHNYFGRHTEGRPVVYNFNSKGFRGPEFIDADITVFGSSFSFGVGLEWTDTWHQQLARMTNKTVNVYSIAGYGIENQELIELYTRYTPTNQVILQLREEAYSTKKYTIPENILVFKIEEDKKDTQCPTFTWASFADHAEDKIHPGVITHSNWAKILIKIWNL